MADAIISIHESARRSVRQMFEPSIFRQKRIFTLSFLSIRRHDIRRSFPWETSGGREFSDPNMTRFTVFRRPEANFHVAPQRGQKIDETPNREARQPVVGQRGNLRRAAPMRFAAAAWRSPETSIASLIATARSILVSSHAGFGIGSHRRSSDCQALLCAKLAPRDVCIAGLEGFRGLD